MIKDVKAIIDEIVKSLQNKSKVSDKIYTDEPIVRTAARMKNYLPEEYRKMRALARRQDTYQCSSEWLFYQQGKLMENFRDDFDFSAQVTRYYPTYQQFSDNELRGYFSWRTKLRDGIIEKTSASFAFLYIYELLNLIGVSSPEEGYQKLAAFRDEYAPLDETILRYLNIWLSDFVVYYGLDVSMIPFHTTADYSEYLTILQTYETQSNETIFSALARFSSYKIENSKFYKDFTEDVRSVAVTVYKEMSALYAKSRKNTYFTHLFGTLSPSYYHMFRSAVFYQKKKHEDTVYTVNAFHHYVCSNGVWSCERYYSDEKNRELGDILRYIDGRMRVVYHYKSLLKEQSVTKQVMKIVEKAIAALEDEKKKQEAAKIVIDVSKLQGIRIASEITRDKLIVEEDEEAEVISHIEEKTAEFPPSQPEGIDYGLTDGECALLRALIDGTDANTVARLNGLMLSVAVDSINEKLFDEFGDTVIIFKGDSPIILEDYLDDLKGIIA